MEGSADVSLQEDHGEDDGPEFDEALDPEFEKVFDVDNDPKLEERDIHEVDALLGIESVDSVDSASETDATSSEPPS
jgi:hypothetical protein